MQRNFSVDDILGTFWKLDTQGESKAGPVTIPEGEEAEDEEASYLPVVESLKTIEVDHRGMNRSASEYAFQEFLKVNDVGFTRAKSRFVTGSDEIRDREEEDEEEEDDDDDDDDDDDTDPPSPASPESPEISESKTQLLAKQESDEFPGAPIVVQQPKLEVRTLSGVVDQVEVGGALNPLFSGIRDEVEIAATATNSPQEYEFFLKKKLDLACAAVALSRSGSGGASTGPLTPQSSLTPEAFGAMAVGNPIGIPALPPKPEYGAMVPPTRSRAVTSGSDVSEDDESEQSHNVAPGDIKRVKRMLSNRESARRSRRRKQAHLSELEAQVAQLRLENSTMLKRVTEVTIKFQEAAIENRVLKADVATLQAKLKMAESMVSGVTNGPVDSPHSGPRYMAYSMGDNGPQYVQPAPVVQQKEQQQQQQQQGFTGGKMGRTPSMQRVASLEHLQKRIRGGAACNNPAWPGSFEDGHSMLEQHEN